MCKSETCTGQGGPVVLSGPAARQDQGIQQDRQGQEKKLSPVHASAIYTLSFSIFRHLRIQHLRIVMTSHRQTFPRRVFTPTQHTPSLTHYLLLCEETNSYQIVARSSLKNINDDVTFILIHNKILQAKIVFHDSLEDCNSEYARLIRLSQDQVDDQNDDDSIQDAINIINSYMTNIRSSKIDRTRLSSSTSSSPRISTCAQISEKIDVQGYA
ncbi:unnamed protein product [Rotaria socialis]|uniref:Uncharacterized protein n=3 Tax=Rotaria socialis TaxID=392032 RepID=A0A818EIC8_9BILA|nr:unnamed protein product [Rotaria socialis]CAF4108774.1 unnamed protein product [Rotaria socialis]